MLYNVLSVRKKPPKTAPFPLRFHQSAGGGPSHGHRQHAQKKLIKIARVVSEICWRTDRQIDTQTHTDVLIAILRHRSRGRSKYVVVKCGFHSAECIVGLHAVRLPAHRLCRPGTTTTHCPRSAHNAPTRQRRLLTRLLWIRGMRRLPSFRVVIVNVIDDVTTA